jgi:hypothetical protein
MWLAPRFCGRGESRYDKFSCHSNSGYVATLTVSPTFAAVKHGAERPAAERPNRSDLTNQTYKRISRIRTEDCICLSLRINRPPSPWQQAFRCRESSKLRQ